MCILTAATTAVFDAMEEPDEKFKTGHKLKFYGDGYEKVLDIQGRKIHSIPLMAQRRYGFSFTASQVVDFIPRVLNRKTRP